MLRLNGSTEGDFGHARRPERTSSSKAPERRRRRVISTRRRERRQAGIRCDSALWQDCSKRPRSLIGSPSTTSVARCEAMPRALSAHDNFSVTPTRKSLSGCTCASLKSFGPCAKATGKDQLNRTTWAMARGRTRIGVHKRSKDGGTFYVGVFAACVLRSMPRPICWLPGLVIKKALGSDLLAGSKLFLGFAQIPG